MHVTKHYGDRIIRMDHGIYKKQTKINTLIRRFPVLNVTNVLVHRYFCFETVPQLTHIRDLINLVQDTVPYE